LRDVAAATESTGPNAGPLAARGALALAVRLAVGGAVAAPLGAAWAAGGRMRRPVHRARFGRRGVCRGRGRYANAAIRHP